MAAITTRMKSLRDRLGWTQAELSERSGVPIQTISRWENNHVQCFDRTVLAKLSKALRIEPGFMFVWED